MYSKYFKAPEEWCSLKQQLVGSNAERIELVHETVTYKAQFDGLAQKYHSQYMEQGIKGDQRSLILGNVEQSVSSKPMG